MNKEVLAAKQETVAEITAALNDCGSLTVVSYQGLTVKETTELRRALASKGCHMVVYKNKLVERALEDKGTLSSKDISKDPTPSSSPRKSAMAQPCYANSPNSTRLSWSRAVWSKAKPTMPKA